MINQSINIRLLMACQYTQSSGSMELPDFNRQLAVS